MQRIDPESVACLALRLIRNLGADFQQFEPQRQLPYLPSGKLAADDQLPGDDAVPAEEEQGVVRTQTPVVKVFAVQISDNERPVEHVEFGLILFRSVIRQIEPSFDDLAQVPAFDESLHMLGPEFFSLEYLLGGVVVFLVPVFHDLDRFVQLLFCHVMCVYMLIEYGTVH